MKINNVDISELKNVTVFVVDDNPNNLSVIKDHLLQHDLNPIPLKSGEAAITLIEKVQPDIILMDVQMFGGIDGFEACRRLKKLEISKDIPVIFISAVSETIDKVSGFSAGGVDYLTKPIVIDELLSRIYVHIKIYRLQKELKESRDNLEVIVNKRTEELINYKDYLSNIINAMPSMVIGIDNNLKVLESNSSVEEFTGLNKSKIQGEEIFSVLSFLSDDKILFIDSINTGKTNERLRKEVVFDKERKYYDLFIFPLKTPGFEGAVIRLDDITNRVYMEEIMAQSEKMMSIGGLAAGMAHEINNPLAAIIQSAGIIENRLTKMIDNNSSKKIAEESGISLQALKEFIEKRNIVAIIENIKKSCKRLSEIVNNMLGFVSKNSSEHSRYFLPDIMDQCIDLASMDYNMKKKYDFKMIKIIKEYEDNLPYIPCNKSKIEQVFLNILQNGAMAMEKVKGIEHKFIIRMVSEDSYLRVEVEDSGPGIKDEIKNKVFDPFFTTKPPGVGTGLGLSISYYIITQEHNGVINVVTAPNGGAKFIIKLPVKKLDRS